MKERILKTQKKFTFHGNLKEIPLSSNQTLKSQAYKQKENGFFRVTLALLYLLILGSGSMVAATQRRMSQPPPGTDGNQFSEDEENHGETTDWLIQQIPLDSVGKMAPYLAKIENPVDQIYFIVSEIPQLINNANHDGDTPLHIACLYGDEASIDSLVKKGANINIKNKEGKTPLEFLMQAYLTKGARLYGVIELFLENGAEIENLYNRLLFYPSLFDDLKTFRLFKRYGADINAVDKEGVSVLINAIHYNSIEIIQELLKDRGLKIEESGMLNPISVSIVYKRAQILELLIKDSRINIEKEYPSGEKAIHKIMHEEIYNYECLKVLLENNVNVNALSMNGETALILAAKTGNKQAVLLLLNWNANSNIKDKDGYTALNFSKAKKNSPPHRNITNILEEYEAILLLLSQKQYGKVRQQINISPQKTQLYLQRIDALSYAAQGNYLQGIEKTKMLVKQYEKNGSLRYELATYYYSAAHFHKAFEEINKAIQLSPNNKEYLRYKEIIKFCLDSIFTVAEMKKQTIQSIITSQFKLPQYLLTIDDKYNYIPQLQSGPGITGKKNEENYKKWSKAISLVEAGDHITAKLLLEELIQHSTEGIPDYPVYHVALSQIYGSLAKISKNTQDSIQKYIIAFGLSAGKNPICEAQFLNLLKKEKYDRHLLVHGYFQLMKRLEYFLWHKKAYTIQEYFIECKNTLELIEESLKDLDDRKSLIHLYENLYNMYGEITSKSRLDKDLEKTIYIAIEYQKLLSIDDDNLKNTPYILLNKTSETTKILMEDEKLGGKETKKFFFDFKETLKRIKFYSIGHKPKMKLELDPQPKLEPGYNYEDFIPYIDYISKFILASFLFFISIHALIISIFERQKSESPPTLQKTKKPKKNKEKQNINIMLRDTPTYNPESNPFSTNDDPIQILKPSLASNNSTNTSNDSIRDIEQEVLEANRKAMIEKMLKKEEKNNLRHKKNILKKTKHKNVEVVNKRENNNNENNNKPKPENKISKKDPIQHLIVKTPQLPPENLYKVATSNPIKPKKASTKSYNVFNRFSTLELALNKTEQISEKIPYLEAALIHSKNILAFHVTKNELINNSLDTLRKKYSFIQDLVFFCETIILCFPYIESYLPNIRVFKQLRGAARHRWPAIIYACLEQEISNEINFIEKTKVFISQITENIEKLLEGKRTEKKAIHLELLNKYYDPDIVLCKQIIAMQEEHLNYFYNKVMKPGPTFINNYKAAISCLVCFGDILKYLRDEYWGFYNLFINSRHSQSISHLKEKTKELYENVLQEKDKDLISNLSLDLNLLENFPTTPLLTTFTIFPRYELFQTMTQKDMAKLCIDICNALGHRPNTQIDIKLFDALIPEIKNRLKIISNNIEKAIPIIRQMQLRKSVSQIILVKYLNCTDVYSPSYYIILKICDFVQFGVSSYFEAKNKETHKLNINRIRSCSFFRKISSPQPIPTPEPEQDFGQSNSSLTM